MRRLVLASILLLLAIGASRIILSVRASRRSAEAARQFLVGKQLIEANCVDCMGSSATGVVRGLAALNDAMELGKPGRKAVYALLVEGLSKHGDLH